jgi:protein TonB
MIEKKDSRVNLEKNRATVFGIGLLAASSFTLAAFTYTSPLEVEEAKIAAFQTNVSYEVQQADALKIEPEIVDNAENEVEEFTDEALQEISEDVEVTNNSDQLESSTVTAGNQERLVGPGRMHIVPKKAIPGAVLYPDKEAEFIGGFVELKKFIINTQVYPDLAIAGDEQGTANVRFIIERDGSVSNVKATGDLSRTLKKEAERVVKRSPNWIPGEVGGKRVRCIVSLPITFVLE